MYNIGFLGFIQLYIDVMRSICITNELRRMNSRRKLFYKLIVSYNDLKNYDNKISM